MDYTQLASELIGIQTAFDRLPVSAELKGVYCGEYLALSFLSERGGAAHPKELSSFMRVSTARIAAILRHLEEKDWVRRRPDERDERKVVVKLTAEGRALVGIKREEAIEDMRRLLMALEPAEAAEYVRLRRKLVSAALDLAKNEEGTI